MFQCSNVKYCHKMRCHNYNRLWFYSLYTIKFSSVQFTFNSIQ